MSEQNLTTPNNEAFIRFGENYNGEILYYSEGIQCYESFHSKRSGRDTVQMLLHKEFIPKAKAEEFKMKIAERSEEKLPEELASMPLPEKVRRFFTRGPTAYQQTGHGQN